jgi:hypothetical protein
MIHYTTVRAVLEILYFLSGIAVAVLAGFGLRQIWIASEQLKFTKEIVEANKKREAVKLAAELCKYFAETVAPAAQDLWVEYTRLNLHGLDLKKEGIKIVCHDTEVKDVIFDFRLLNEEWSKFDWKVTNYLNRLESFAIPFAAGVSDNEIGYQETASAFCTAVLSVLPAIWHVRQTQPGVKYKSALSLFCIWNNRLMAESKETELKHLQALLGLVDKQRSKVKPI